MNEESKKPTGYTVTMPADVFSVFMAVYGNTCTVDRIKNFGISKALDNKTSVAWGEFTSELEKHGQRIRNVYDGE